MILDSSYFVSAGTIYLFKRDGDEWRLASHTNITKYLKGYKVEHILSERLEKYEEFESHNPFVYNDRFVVVLAWKSESKQAAFVFKRNGDNLDFFARIPNISADCLSLSDDNFLMTTGTDRESKLFCIEEYDLNGAKLTLSRTTFPPVVDREDAQNSYGAKENEYRKFKSYFKRRGDYLLVESSQAVPESENDYALSPGNPSVDYLLFHKVGGEWRYEQSLLNLIPRDIYRSGRCNPFRSLIRCEFNDNRLQLSFYDPVTCEKGLIEFQRNESTGFLEVSTIDFKKYLQDDKKDDSYDDATRVNLVIQERDNASLATMNKATQIGILPPSSEKTPQVLAPKWVAGSGDPETTSLVLDYYKNNLVESFVKDYGYDNFYDWTDAVPTLHYSVNGSDLLVSYVFKDCFFAGYPMQKAEVWAGVDFYRIDEERGPIKVSSFVTRDLKPLAPR